MRRSCFFEGFFLGTIAGVLLGYFFDLEKEGKKLAKKAEEFSASVSNNNNNGASGRDSATQAEIKDSQERTENLVAKTLDAIDHGFSKLSQILEEKKGKTK